MKSRSKLMVALISVLPFFTGGAQAMTIDDFTAMNNDDDAAYIALLVEAASKMFKAQGQPDQAAKALAFFKDPGPNGGVHQLATYLKLVHAENLKHSTNPNNRAPELQVEDALAMAFKDDGLIVPAKVLLASGKDFHAAGPPRAQMTSP